MNIFLDEMRADGTLDDMYKRWLVDENETMPDIPTNDSPAQHLIVGTTGVVYPYSYYKGTELNGYDIELAKRFGAWLDADIEFKVYDYGAIIMAAHSGDVDCIMANLNVTPERSEAILFSEPMFCIRTGIMVRDEALAGGKYGIISDIRESFYKTFIRESRWKLFVEGIGTTLLITVFSILFGTLLGFCVFLACRN
ncbi:MAG: transporter substrate-binding domain-containing protein, partial [Acetatifactor sp.]|nr:transporter substrate-binding domain-containing protein [Acetatifactor sp.]